MDEAVVAQTALTIGIALIFIGFLVWAIKTGQFRNIEEPKYRIFEDYSKRPDEKVSTVKSKKERRVSNRGGKEE